MDNLEVKRHTLSHVLAAAVQELYPHAKFGIGPAIDNGFYYDIDFGTTKISDTDLAKLEKAMRRIISRKPKMTKRTVSRADALKWAKDNKQTYKVELIEDLPKDEEVTFYDLGDAFTDLCKGPHAKDTSDLGVFKLDHIAGAYWRGDEKGKCSPAFTVSPSLPKKSLRHMRRDRRKPKNATIVRLAPS